MYYFIVNKTGGSGKAAALWEEGRRYLDSEGIAYKEYLTQRAHHATEIAKEINAMDDDDIRLVVVGGDGTINEVLSGIYDFDRIRFGVMPVGSANDFAAGMGLQSDPMSVLKDLVSDRPLRRMDIGQVILPDGSKRIFGISTGIGMDAIVCKKALTSRIKVVLNKIGLGSLTYVILTLITLLGMKYTDVTLKLYNKDDVETINVPKMIFAASMNIPIEGGGVMMTPGAGFDDGKLTLCAAHSVPRLFSIGKLVTIIRKKHVNDKKHFIIRDFDRMEISAAEPMVVHTDGEYAGDVTDLTVEVLAGRLRLI